MPVTITTNIIAPNAVTNIRIADNAITSQKLLITRFNVLIGQMNFKSPFADTADFARACLLLQENAGGDLGRTFPNPTLAKRSFLHKKNN